MKTYKWFVITVLVLALSMHGTPVSAAPSASIVITPLPPNPVPIGTEIFFDLVISVTDITPGVAGAEIYLAYDPAFVAPPASPLSVAVALPDFFGVSNISIKEVLPASQCPGGTKPCVHLVVAGPAQTTHTGAAARFYFRGQATGSACFTVLESKMANADGFPVAHTIIPPNPPCVTISGNPDVIGNVQRQGTPGNPNPGGGTLACSEGKLTSGSTTVGPVFTDGSGNFKLTGVPGGTYTLRANYPGYLASEKPITITAGGPTTIDVGKTTLRGGDVNGDNKINILDVGTIISKFKMSGVEVKSDPPDCTDPDEPADINDNGIIDLDDIVIITGENFGRTGPTVWP